MRWLLCIYFFAMISPGFAHEYDYADKPFTPSKPFTPDGDHYHDGRGHDGAPHSGWPDSHSDGWYNPGKSIPNHKNYRHKPHSPHDKHYRKNFSQRYKKYRNHSHETYRYHTHYLAPIKRHYHRHGHRLHVLPVGFIAINTNGFTYFYFDGVFYLNDGDGFLVVQAPVGATVPFLPMGFITFKHGLASYYYVNGTYFIWDNVLASYVVIEKPNDADSAIRDETQGRLFAYPKQGQTEQQQSTDRYDCHRWAAKEVNVDPGIDAQEGISDTQKQSYQRAISACLEARGYAVKY